MIDLGDLKSWLKVSGSADDAELTELESRAVDFLERETGRYFGPETGRVFRRKGDGTVELHLPESAIRVISVEERSDPSSAWATFDVGDYELDGFKLYRSDGGTWIRGYEYRVNFDFGYAEEREPPEIRQLVLDLVKLKWDDRVRGSGLQSERKGEQSYTRFASGDLRSVPGADAVRRRWKLPPGF